MGPKALRKKRIMRMTTEAKDQGALLTQEDLAVLLCNAPRTIRYDIDEIRSEGIEIATKGLDPMIKNGRRFEAKIVELFLNGLDIHEIEERTQHSQEVIVGHLADFNRMVHLFDRSKSLQEITQIIRLPEKLIDEYFLIYKVIGLKEGTHIKMKETLSLLSMIQTPSHPLAFNSASISSNGEFNNITDSACKKNLQNG